MDNIYDVKTRYFTKDNGEKVKLSRLEHKLLIALSNEKLTFYDDISQYLYKSKYKFTQEGVRGIKKLLIKKTNLNIRAINSRGYILESDVYYM